MPLFRRHVLAGAPIRRRHRSCGQSLVEFALVLPLMLLLLLIGIDFGRVFLGWVNLNNAVRVAANYAAMNPNVAWGTGSKYQHLVTTDAAGINCALPALVPAPTFPNGTALGEPAQVSITCDFSLITPIISNVIGNPLHVTSSAAFPIRFGVIANIPTGSTLPSVATTLSKQSASVGDAVHDSAKLFNATSDAGGTVKYTGLHTNSACSAGVKVAGTVTVTGGVAPNPITFSIAGTYYWQAVYSGDTKNNGATSSCGSEVLPVGVTILTTLSSNSGVAGVTVHDSATLFNVTSNVGGTVKYTAYTNSACSAGPKDAGTVTLTTGGVVPDSNPVTFGSSGTYYWQAVYSGDIALGGTNQPATAPVGPRSFSSTRSAPCPTWSRRKRPSKLRRIGRRRCSRSPRSSRRSTRQAARTSRASQLLREPRNRAARRRSR